MFPSGTDVQAMDNSKSMVEPVQMSPLSVEIPWPQPHQLMCPELQEESLRRQPDSLLPCLAYAVCGSGWQGKDNYNIDMLWALRTALLCLLPSRYSVCQNKQ